MEHTGNTMIVRGGQPILTIDGARKILTSLADGRTDERTRIGNTPTCEDCDQPQDHCTCDDNAGEWDTTACMLDLDSSECPDCGGIGTDHHAGCDSSDLTISQQAKTILSDTDDALSADINLVALTALAARELLNGYDYKNQAWLQDGKYVSCGHPKPCTCYGTIHEGQSPALDAEIH